MISCVFTGYCAGDWDLVIEQVQVEDEAEYECQVGDIRSRSARLEVNVKSGLPVIRSDGHTVRVTEGVEAELECRSEGGKPAAKVRGGGVFDTHNLYTACMGWRCGTYTTENNSYKRGR